jgi:hypothetical protein
MTEKVVIANECEAIQRRKITDFLDYRADKKLSARNDK